MTRVYWRLSDYISHRRAGEAYRRCLPLAGLQAVDSPDAADVVVLHDDPIFWAQIVAQEPAMKGRPLIGYAVWEGMALPDVYRAGLALVEAVWTASTFSAAALGQGHDRVRVLPHVVEAVSCTEGDRAWLRSRLKLEPDARYFLSITDAVNPRKNLDALLRVFARVVHVHPDARLVLKQYRMNVSFGQNPNIISVAESVTDGQMAALHAGALGYVAPHRGEAWGLGLSEAMSHGASVLATGWSGNMDFMDRRNSVPLRYALVPVGEGMARMLPHFRPDMLWAEVDEAHLEREMLRLIRRGPDSALRVRAHAVCERFSPLRVAMRLARLVQECEARSL